MSVINIVGLSFFGISELFGQHLGYSKFWNVSIKKKKNEFTLSSRTGMLILYAPAAVAAAASFFLPGAVVGLRAQLVSLALAIHFFKRVFEVLFIHKYSGRMQLLSTIIISSSYTINTINIIYTQHLSQSQSIREPAIDLKYPGILLSIIGILGNFYHHLLLANLRGKDEKGYKIPSGGLFGLVICPHYLFEIIVFFGLSLIAQTAYAFCFTAGTVVYLMGRSLATRRWYVSKFEDQFPREIKALVPFVF
ncbi:uncharacterized protein A4U43_C03F4360 [Asparagus officinalis]|uniref:3-oxo-5-alpha-steroid 4-dehydrogenase C-terminal domain-containing protein n=2 Tax=Asparagus officinalis TaxID=4686 RepID=A0A5P1F929_ASPOF|nr:uncharacterized protein A4U43_C03F4360 [Asparagus officinalis]